MLSTYQKMTCNIFLCALIFIIYAVSGVLKTPVNNIEIYTRLYCIHVQEFVF